MAESNFSGNSNYTGILNVDSFGNWNLQVRKNAGTGYWTNGGSPWSVSINGANWSGSWTYDFRVTNLITIASQATHGAYPRPALGTNVGASWSVSMQSGIGTSSGSFSFFAAGTASTPGAPNPVGIDQITPTSMRYRFSGTTDGGSPIIRWEYQYSTSSNFSSGNSAILTGSGTENVSGLTPNTTYYFRSRGVNAVGNGAWSATSSASTLPATPPGMTLEPSLSGLGMTVSLTPPGGATGVTKYRVEYRIGTDPATVVENPTSPIVVSGLTPGQVYQWRASAFFGTYESPYTGWTPLAQPNPNTTPGNYFDGSTVPETGSDVTYAWNGTASNSTSRAIGVGVDGWILGAAVTARATLQQVRGGLFGSFAARLNINRDITDVTVGSLFKIGYADLEEGATYVGSVYVNPPRETRLSLRLAAADDLVTIDTIAGEPVIVPGGEWTRLIVSGVFPAGALYGLLEVWAETGAGYTPFISGDQIYADGAMISLGTLYPWFSGDTPDTALYDYAWEGAPNASVSARNELSPTFVDPLADPDCPPVPAPPSLPSIPSECIDEVGTWRRYIIQVNSGYVRKFTASLPTLTLSTETSPERQVRIRYYPNPDGVAPELIDMSAWEAEQIITYIPPHTSITLDGVSQLVWASVDGGPLMAADRLLYGTNGMPATWPVLTCGDGYVITLDVPLDAPSGNLTTELFITQRM